MARGPTVNGGDVANCILPTGEVEGDGSGDELAEEEDEEDKGEGLSEVHTCSWRAVEGIAILGEVGICEDELLSL